jgi:hypothetical protein
MSVNSGGTGVSIRLSWLNPTVVLIGRPWLVIDGAFPVDVTWGEEFFPLSGGAHTIQCGIRIFRGFRIVGRDLQFKVFDGKTTRIRLIAPLLLGFSGRWKQLDID